jgi:hypothetical protein
MFFSMVITGGLPAEIAGTVQGITTGHGMLSILVMFHLVFAVFQGIIVQFMRKSPVIPTKIMIVG